MSHCSFTTSTTRPSGPIVDVADSMDYISPLQRRPPPPRPRLNHNAVAEVITIDEETASSTEITVVEHFAVNPPKQVGSCDESGEKACHLEEDNGVIEAPEPADEEEIKSTSVGDRMNYPPSDGRERKDELSGYSSAYLPEAQDATESSNEGDRSQLTTTSTDTPQPCMPVEEAEPPMPLSCIYLPHRPVHKALDRPRESFGNRRTSGEKDWNDRRHDGLTRGHESGRYSDERRQRWDNSYAEDRRHSHRPYNNSGSFPHNRPYHHRRSTYDEGPANYERSRVNRNYNPRRRPSEFPRPSFPSRAQNYDYKNRQSQYNSRGAQFAETSYNVYFTSLPTTSYSHHPGSHAEVEPHSASQEESYSSSKTTLGTQYQAATITNGRQAAANDQLDIVRRQEGGESERVREKATEEEHNEDFDMREQFGGHTAPFAEISHPTIT